MTGTAPVVPVAVTAVWRTRLLLLADDVTWGLDRQAIDRRLRAVIDDMTNTERTSLEEAR